MNTQREENTRKQQQGAHPTPSAPRTKTSRPWQTVTITISATTTNKNEGTRRIMSITDAHTRHVIAIPMSIITARRIRKAIFRKLICKYGMPEHIHADSSTEIKNAMAHGTRTEGNIKHSNTGQPPPRVTRRTKQQTE